MERTSSLLEATYEQQPADPELSVLLYTIVYAGLGWSETLGDQRALLCGCTQVGYGDRRASASLLKQGPDNTSFITH